MRHVFVSGATRAPAPPPFRLTRPNGLRIILRNSRARRAGECIHAPSGAPHVAEWSQLRMGPVTAFVFAESARREPAAAGSRCARRTRAERTDAMPPTATAGRWGHNPGPTRFPVRLQHTIARTDSFGRSLSGHRARRPPGLLAAGTPLRRPRIARGTSLRGQARAAPAGGDELLVHASTILQRRRHGPGRATVPALDCWGSSAPLPLSRVTRLAPGSVAAPWARPPSRVDG